MDGNKLMSLISKYAEEGFKDNVSLFDNQINDAFEEFDKQGVHFTKEQRELLHHLHVATIKQQIEISTAATLKVISEMQNEK